MVVQKLDSLLMQRVTSLLLGHEDQNDDSTLCKDKALALIIETSGVNRENCEPMGSGSQMQRLEQAGHDFGASDTNKFGFDQNHFNLMLLANCVQRVKNNRQKQSIIDFDGTSKELHGNQEG